MPLTDFAHEIQLHIVQFCSRNDVASLSRIHTALQDVAESVLYSHVVIEGESDRSLGLAKLDKGQTQPSLKENRSPLYALFSNSRKAAMVKALRVDLGCPYKISGRGWYNYDDDWLHGFVVNKIAEALEQMLNLVDLRVRSGRAGEAFKGSITSIGEVIRFVLVTMMITDYDSIPHRGGHFQLHTLCLSHYVHDLEGIIVSQPNLRLFGVYYHFRLCATVCKKLDGVFQHLLSHRHTIELKLFLLHYSKSKDGSTAVINMLPFLHRPGEALQTCIEAEKLTEWPDDFREASGHSSLSLVGISEENISLLEESMEAMAECVQRGHPYLSNPRLRIHVQHTKIQVSSHLFLGILLYSSSFSRNRGTFQNSSNH